MKVFSDWKRTIPLFGFITFLGIGVVPGSARALPVGTIEQATECQNCTNGCCTVTKKSCPLGGDEDDCIETVTHECCAEPAPAGAATSISPSVFNPSVLTPAGDGGVVRPQRPSWFNSTELKKR